MGRADAVLTSVTVPRPVARVLPGVRTRLRAEAPFLVVLAVAAALRLAVLLGFPPVLWFWGDSFAYLGVALHPAPYDVRPVGYSFFLQALQPLHSLAAVAAVQHLVGLGVGVAVYLLLRRLAVPRGLATAGAAPVLLDAYQLQLEQLLMAETLTLGLVAGALGLLVWPDRPSRAACAWAGLLLALAVLTRSAAVVVTAPALLYLLVRRAGAVRLALAALAFVVPLHLNTGWFWAVHGERSLTASDGFFLYGRVMTWASCGQLDLPAADVVCDERPVDERPGVEWYVWHPESPAFDLPGTRVEQNEVLRDFAVGVVREQPLGYAQAVLADLGRLVDPVRRALPSEFTRANYLFSRPPRELPPAAVADALRYQEGEGDVRTRPVPLLAPALAAYQAVAYVPSPLYVVAALVAAAGVVRGRSRGSDDRRRAVAALLLLSGSGQVLLRIAVQGFDYRYELPALPLLAAAAALGVQLLRERRAADVPPERIELPTPSLGRRRSVH